MKINGLQKLTLLDFPGRPACTVFLAGCNYRCPFCHNSDLLTAEADVLMDSDELLDFLKENRLKIALATSTSRRTSELNLKITGTAKYFDALVCGEDVKNGKPDPEVFLTAASRLGVAPECCAAFEDSVNGILSAYDAGMTTVMVPDYVQPTEELLPKISFLCGDLSESVECLRPLI